MAVNNGTGKLRCFECKAVGHKKSECPNLNGAFAVVCSKCGIFHPPHIPWYVWGVKNAYAYAPFPSQVMYAAAGEATNDESMCAKCHVVHSPHVPCYARVYAASAYPVTRVTGAVYECVDSAYDGYTVPICINGRELSAVRDSGCCLEAIVQPSVVKDTDYTGHVVLCRGAFDSESVAYKVPLANVELFAPYSVTNLLESR